MIEEKFIATIIQCFFIAFGIVIGGAIIGSIGSFFTGEAPITAMSRIARGLRIWAIVSAIGGTFDAIANFERGVIDGATIDVVKQILLIISAMGGVKAAIIVLQWLMQEEVS